jgi:hypothetical protein
MAAVNVFVDDAIRGDLPRVCAKTGEPTDLVIRIRQPVRGGLPPVAWLLLILGPLGIVGLFVLALAWPGAEYLTVRVPETEASFQNERQLERWRLVALGAGVFVPLLGILGVGMFPLLWLGCGAGFFLVAGALTWMLWRQSISVSIDVSRRWVTLAGVHPAFAAAVERQEAAAASRR